MTELLAALEASSFSTWLRESSSIWAYPTVLTLHTLGLAVLVGANVAFDLRLLGFGASLRLEDLRPLFRAMWIGFWVNAISGAMLLAADATTKAATPLFLIKLTLVAVGVVLIVMTRRVVYRNGASGTVTAAGKALAIGSLTVWLIAIAAGRLMAYPGLFFGL
jgi:hypothetical protein